MTPATETAPEPEAPGLLKMELAPDGMPTLRVDDVWLEDPEDPVAASKAFVSPDVVAGADQLVLFGSGLGYRPLRLKTLGAKRLVIVEPVEEVLVTAQELLPDAFEGVTCVRRIDALLDTLSSSGSADERIVLLSPPGYAEAYPAFHARVQEAIRDAQGFRRMREQSASGRRAMVLRSGLASLRYASGIPLALAAGQPLRGRPAFLVSAGPSLDRNRHLLNDARKKGALFAVNTAAKALHGELDALDVLVRIESLTASPELAAIAERTAVLALDLVADADTFALDTAHKALFVQEHEALAPLVEALGMTPLRYGATVATAAFALARTWGADPIVLVGQDLAYTGGQAYATGTGRERWRTSVDEGVITIDYDEATAEAFRAKGLALPHKSQPCLEVPAWGGDERVSTTYDLTLFRRWFEAAAEHYDGRFINATEGGASIRGWEERSLDAVLAELPELATPSAEVLGTALAQAPQVPASALRRLRKDGSRSARAVLDASRRASARGARARAKAVTRAAAKAPLVQAHASGALETLRREGDAGLDARAAALEASAEAVLAALR
ncbi:MAG: 6-hydroxymethylpterin diphosphokinase MptE-like protein [Myxococcota bacterium]